MHMLHRAPSLSLHLTLPRLCLYLRIFLFLCFCLPVHLNLWLFVHLDSSFQVNGFLVIREREREDGKEGGRAHPEFLLFLLPLPYISSVSCFVSLNLLFCLGYFFKFPSVRVSSLVSVFDSLPVSLLNFDLALGLFLCTSFFLFVSLTLGLCLHHILPGIICLSLFFSVLGPLQLFFLFNLFVHISSSASTPGCLAGVG